MRGKNLVKLLKTIDLLARPQGATIEEMGEKLELDRRSVYRIIHIIEELGFPIYDEKILLERKKRWKLEDYYLKKLPNLSLPETRLNLAEVISLFFLRGQAGLFKHTEIDRHIRSAFNKLGLLLPPNTLNQFEKIKPLFLSPAKFAKDYSGKEKIIEELTEAMLKNRTCRIRYHSFMDDRIKSFRIDPLHFFEHEGGLYLFARATKFDEIRTLAVERIREITTTTFPFEYPPDFDPEEEMESAFDLVAGDPIHVKIRFSKDQARYIRERKWSGTQKIQDQKDGSIILSMDTSGWQDVKRWVLSYGSSARVLEPKGLREEIRKEAAAMLESQ
jgi:predicted DNA-binding transcriptional regulator YafY